MSRPTSQNLPKGLNTKILFWKGLFSVLICNYMSEYRLTDPHSCTQKEHKISCTMFIGYFPQVVNVKGEVI